MKRQHIIHTSSLERDFCREKIVAFSLRPRSNIKLGLCSGWGLHNDKEARAGPLGGGGPLARSHFVEIQESCWVRVPIRCLLQALWTSWDFFACIFTGCFPSASFLETKPEGNRFPDWLCECLGGQAGRPNRSEKSQPRDVGETHESGDPQRLSPGLRSQTEISCFSGFRQI